MAATDQAGDSAQLDFVRKEQKAKQDSLTTMMGAHGDKIGKVVGSNWTHASLENDFERIVKQKAAIVVDAERQREGTNREMSQLNFKLNTCSNDLKAKQKQLKATEVAIRTAVDCEPTEYPEVVRKLEEERDVLKADAESFKRVLEYFESCIKTAKENNGCKTCNRSFAGSKDLDKMLINMDKEKKKFEGSTDVEEELANVENELQAAKAVSSDVDTWERLKHNEVPTLEKDEKELADKRSKLLTQLEEQDSVVSDRETAQRDVEAITKTVQTIVKYSAEISNFDGQIAELVAKQKSAGLSRGLELIRGDIKKANDESKTVKGHLTKTTGDRDRSEKHINALELESRDVKTKLSAAEYQLKEKQSIETQIQSDRALADEQRNAMKTIDKEVQGLAPQLSQAQAKYDDIDRRGADKDRELRADADKLNSSVNQLQAADREIRAYEERGGEAQLSRAKREVENRKDTVTKLVKEQSDIAREVKQLENQSRDYAETKRGIEDNQQYRRDIRALTTLHQEISELEGRNAEEEYATLKQENATWKMEHNKLAAEQAGLIGSLRAKDQQLAELIEEFDGEFKDAARMYKEAHIKAETTKACVEDLGRYSSALDKAIMKFHTVKMEEINRVVDELWRKTYQGTDVDTIMIKSENEGARSTKSYNYRVVMFKQDAEMDMRGRCSAGQKVLASIIIRLALAECFGTNCGLIALDEPTTNLDRDNIAALAKSLAEIIKVRRAQKNFQLIVITHDEDFLKAMECSDFADHYYRVSRDDKQKSMIERQSIAEVM